MNIDNSHPPSISEESPTKKESQLLCQEIEQCQFNGFGIHSVDLSFDEEYAQNQKQNFQKLELPSDENIQEQRQNTFDGKPLEKLATESESSGPRTITLIEDTGMSKQSGSKNSKMSQYNSSINNQSYSSFLHMKETVYQMHRQNYENLFQKLFNKFSQRILLMEEIYVKFLQVKLEQEKLYAQMYSQQIEGKKNQREISKSIYINCKSVASELKRNNRQEGQRVWRIVMKLEELLKRTRDLFKEVKSVLMGKAHPIEKLISKINSINEDMDSLMLPKEKRKSSKLYEQFHGNAYVISKYLIKKEESYLELVSKFTREVIGFVNVLSSEVEPRISITLKEILLAYAEIQGQYNSSSKQKYKQPLAALSSLNCFETVFSQVVEILLQCIPKSLLKSQTFSGSIPSDQYLQYILEKLNIDAQTFICLQCIQADQENWVYSSSDKTKVKWKKTLENGKLAEQVEIHLILTKQKHIVFEMKKDQQDQDDYIATIRLSDVKISKKNKKIILSDRGKGVIGFLLSSTSILGELSFESLDSSKTDKSEEDSNIQLFIEKVKQVITTKKKTAI